MMFRKTIKYLTAIAVILILTLAVSAGFEYATDDSNNTVIIYGYDGEVPENLVIPATWLGRNVTCIGAGAFQGCTGLKSITIPDTVEIIGNSAFSGCTSLNRITIGKRVTSIGNNVFAGCDQLSEIIVNSGNTKYHSDGNCIIETSEYKLIAGCKNSTIPDDGSVTVIGDNAFCYCTGLSSITIPDSVTSIGENVIAGCDQLSEIIVNSGNKKYHSDGNCLIETSARKLIAGCKNSTIPDDGSVTVIGDNAFYNCTGLDSIMIPDRITSIGYSAFALCGKLKDVVFEGEAPSFYGADTGQASFPTSVNLYYIEGKKGWDENNNYGYYHMQKISQKCGDNAYWVLLSNGELLILGSGDMYDYSKDTASGTVAPWFSIREGISTVTIKDGITSIGNYTFNSCRSLSSVTIPDSVTSIGNSAFNECTSLSSVTIPDSVTSIGEWAFYYCTGLSSVTIPDSVTSIGEWAFSGCTGLSSVTIPDSVTSIGEGAFYYCTGLKSVTIGNSVTSIGNYAFYKCTSLNSVTIPDSVESIGEYAFYGCTIMSSIKLPDGITSIAGCTFEECKGLTSITIPFKVKSIGYKSFNGCEKLQIVYFEGEAPSVYTAYDGGPSFPDTVTLYYIEGKDGWADQIVENSGNVKTWNGYKIKKWNYIVGDVNNSGTIDAADGQLLAHYIAGYKVDPFTHVFADVDFDGEITPRDSMILARHLAGWTGYGTLPYKN